MSTQNQSCFKFNFDVDLTLINLRCFDVEMLTQDQRCFNVEFYRWINFDKSTLNQSEYHVDQLHGVIFTFMNVKLKLNISLGRTLSYTTLKNKELTHF